MHVLIWALGSMVIFMLLIILMPLSLTLKGKVLISFAGFVLALGGLNAVNSFPLWETILLLLTLVFFTSYILDNRLGKLLYKERFSTSEDDCNNEKHSEFDYEKENLNSSVELTELKGLSNDKKVLITPVLLKSEISLQKDNEAILDKDLSFIFDNNSLEEGLNYLDGIENLIKEEYPGQTRSFHV